jgi:DNA invertase Pin-like site-specific DNA recombinase
MQSALSPQTAAQRKAASVLRRVGYARISIEEAKTGGSSIGRQVESLRLVDPDMRVFVDDGVSGTKSSRPEFDRLLQYIKEEGVTELVVARVDRLGRNHQLKTLIPDLYHNQNCKIVCTEEEAPDLSTELGQLVFDLKVNLACAESDRTGKRIQSARERVYRKQVYDQPRAGYVLIDGMLYPDDLPRHCPLAQRREVSGLCDEWGIASDAFPGLSNFELTAIPMKVALRYRNWSAGFRFATQHLLLTRSGSWDQARNRFVEDHARDQYDELVIVGKDIKRVQRIRQSPVPKALSALQGRIQNPIYYGHYYARRNWAEDARPSLNRKRKVVGLIDEDTFEFFQENSHYPMLDDKDYQTLKQINEEIRRARDAGLHFSARGATCPPNGGLDGVALHEYLLTKSLSQVCVCYFCDKPLRFDRTRKNPTKKDPNPGYYQYLRCNNQFCTAKNTRARTGPITAGLAVHLADYAQRIQQGGVEPPQLRPTENSAIRELEEAREAQAIAVTRAPHNRVLRNQLKDLDRQIEALRTGARDSTVPLDQVKAHLRLQHPQAVHAGAWAELLSKDISLAAEVVQMIQSVVVEITATTDKQFRRDSRLGTGSIKALTLRDQL